MNALSVRLALDSDLPAINSIYNHYVEHSTCTYQLEAETEAARLAWFQKRTSAHPVTVAEMDGEVVGWASLNRFHERGAYDRTVDNSIYIRHDRHRRGIGRALLTDQIARARALGHHTLLAGISAEQVASIQLHLTFGFVEAGRLREVGYKHGQWLDVVWMQLLL